MVDLGLVERCYSKHEVGTEDDVNDSYDDFLYSRTHILC